MSAEEAEAVARLYAERRRRDEATSVDASRLASDLGVSVGEVEEMLGEVRGRRKIVFDRSAILSGALALGVCALGFAAFTFATPRRTVVVQVPSVATTSAPAEPAIAQPTGSYEIAPDAPSPASPETTSTSARVFVRVD